MNNKLSVDGRKASHDPIKNMKLVLFSEGLSADEVKKVSLILAGDDRSGGFTVTKDFNNVGGKGQ